MHSRKRAFVLLHAPVLVLVELQCSQARRGVMKIRTYCVHDTLFRAALHHVNHCTLFGGLAGQRNPLERMVNVLGDGRALTDEGPIVEFQNRYRSTGILADELGEAMLAFHHVNMHELYFVRRTFFGQCNADAGWIWKAFVVVNFHVEYFRRWIS